MNLKNVEPSRAFKLQLILESYAPHVSDRSFIRSIYNEMVANESPEYVEKGIVGALSDGLNYGNWPWSHFKRES